MMMLTRILSLALLSLLCTAGTTTASHPWHVSLAEIEYNPLRKTFEVALCVWPEDLQKAVSKMEDRSINIDTESERVRDKLFQKYVERKLQFLPSKKVEKDGEVTAASIRWVGSELTLKKGWLYFEVDAKAASGGGWSIENRLFLELNEDQLNLVQIKAGKNLESRTLSANQPSLDWSLNTESKSIGIRN